MPKIIPIASILSPPTRPDTRAQPTIIIHSAAIFGFENFSPRNIAEKTVTYIGAVYISTTAVEIDVLVIDIK